MRFSRLLFAAIPVVMLATRATPAIAVWPTGGLLVGDSVVTRFQPTVSALPVGSNGVLAFANPWDAATRIDAPGEIAWRVHPYAPSSFPRSTAFASDGADGVWMAMSSGTTQILAGHWDANGIQVGGLTTVWSSSSISEARYARGAASDGAGGVFVVWTDILTQGSDAVRVSHVDAAGVVVGPANGVLVFGGTGGRLLREAVADGVGGLLLLSPDALGATVQRLDGSLVPQWSASGVHLAPPGIVGDFSLAATGDGGAFVAWTEGPNTLGTVRLLRLNASGAPAAGWPAAGASVAAERLAPGMARVAADGLGGACVAWSESRTVQGGTESDLRVARLLADGSPAPGWPLSGAVAGSSIYSPALHEHSTLVPDGLGGCYIAWAIVSQPGAGVRAQHVAASGGLFAGWPAAGAALSGGEFPSFSGPATVTDGTGGAYAVWEEYRYPVAAHEGLHVLRVARLQPDGVLAVESPGHATLALGGVVPNPARGRFAVIVTLPDDRSARLELFDLAGRSTFRREIQGAGRHDITIDGATLATGVHWLRLSHGSGVRMGRIVVLR
jgi:hypothetical protein